MRTRRAQVETTVAPVAQAAVNITGAGLDVRMMHMLGIPPPVVDLILNTTYTVGQLQIPLFATERSASDPRLWVYNNQEIQEAVRVYDLFKGAHTGTGEENNPVRAPYSAAPADQTKIVSDEEAYAKFSTYIAGLALNKVLKIKKDLLVDDDSVFEAPALADYRREEIVKNTLSSRRRVPIQGSCRRGGCKSTEIYQDELFIRAGDEGGVWFNECAKCGNRWKA